jgi:hypothetical protein
VKTDAVQPLNYSAHALEDLRRLQKDMSATAPGSAAALGILIDRLRRSVKFILPNCCELIDPNDLRQAHLDLLRLPFPCVAFEAPWIREEPSSEIIGGQRQSAATKRISLCYEILPEHKFMRGMNRLLERYPDGGICVVPIFWGPEFVDWCVACGGTFVPYGTEMGHQPLEQLSPASRLEREALRAAGQVKPGAAGFTAEPFVLFPELFERAIPKYGSREQALTHIFLDSHDEVMVLIQACSVLNCSNVSTTDMPAPAYINQKRQAKGKQPFFSYKVLQLATDLRAVGRDAQGGHHASPRMHLRRGHVRRLGNRTVWVKPSMVNAQTMRGIVAKDYSLSRSD